MAGGREGGDARKRKEGAARMSRQVPCFAPGPGGGGKKKKKKKGNGEAMLILLETRLSVSRLRGAGEGEEGARERRGGDGTGIGAPGRQLRARLLKKSPAASAEQGKRGGKKGSPGFCAVGFGPNLGPSFFPREESLKGEKKKGPGGRKTGSHPLTFLLAFPSLISDKEEGKRGEPCGGKKKKASKCRQPANV